MTDWLTNACRETGVHPSVFNRKGTCGQLMYRSPKAARERVLVWVWLYKNTHLSGPDIAELTGGNRKAHSTVFSAIRALDARRAALASALAAGTSNNTEGAE